MCKETRPRGQRCVFKPLFHYSFFYNFLIFSLLVAPSSSLLLPPRPCFLLDPLFSSSSMAWRQIVWRRISPFFNIRRRIFAQTSIRGNLVATLGTMTTTTSPTRTSEGAGKHLRRGKQGGPRGKLGGPWGKLGGPRG